MKLIIDTNRKVNPVGTWGTKNENDYEILDFEFPEELESFNKRIVYYLGDDRVWDTIVDNKAYITNAITTKGKVQAYVWCTKTNSEREADTDFRTMLFEMNFYENENADGIVPTPEQVDGFNTMLTAMNNKITEINTLEIAIEGAEANRVEAEQGRVSAENTRVSNEQTRQSNEQTRQTQEASRERRTDEAIASIQDKTAEYNANAEAKTNAFNQNATNKTNDFNSNASSKTTTFNNNASSKTSDFNTNATNKTNAFNENVSHETTTFNNNASSKTTDFNTNATNKTNAFNSNATDKTTNFDNNASSKTTTFNENATSKTNDFNDNATAKTTAFNDNAQAKTEAFDEHTAEITDDIEDLQQEVQELSENMPWTETEQATEFKLTDCAKYSRDKMKLFGNTSQKSYTGYNLVDVSAYQEGTKNGVTLTKDEEGNLILNGTATSAFGWSVILSQSKTLPAGTYTKNVTKDTSIGTGITIGLGYNNSSITSTTTQPNIGLTTMTLGSDTTYDQIRMWIGNGTVFNNYKLNYMILAGEYTAQTIPPYEPYVGGGVQSPNPNYPQDIHVVTGNNTIGVTGKNLLDTTLFNNNSSCTIVDKTNGKLQLQGKSNYYAGIFLEKQLKPSTQYTIQAKVTQIGTKSRGEIFIANSDYPQTGSVPSSGVRLATSNVLTETGDLLCTFTTDSTGIVNIFFDCNHDTTVGTITYENIQLEESSTATSYEPYHLEEYPVNLGNIELCKIGNYQDYLYKENGNWYKYGAIDYNVATGASTERWAWDLRNENKAMVQSTKIGQCIDGRRFIAICSNSFRGAEGNDVFSGTNNNVNIIGCAEQSKIRIAISPSDFADINAFKNSLQENNLEFYFVLATPNITQITDETLIAQLEAIYNHLALVKGTNHITITPSDLAPYVTLNYMQDLPAKLDNLDSRLALLE